MYKSNASNASAKRSGNEAVAVTWLLSLMLQRSPGSDASSGRKDSIARKPSQETLVAWDKTCNGNPVGHTRRMDRAFITSCVGLLQPSAHSTRAESTTYWPVITDWSEALGHA